MAKRARPSHHVDGILDVGGGYAGLHAAHAAAGRSRREMSPRMSTGPERRCRCRPRSPCRRVKAAGANAARVVNGRESERVSLSHQGWVLDLSGHRGIAEFGDISLAGPFADLIPPFLHDAIDLKMVLGMGGWNPFPSFGSFLGRRPAQ